MKEWDPFPFILNKTIVFRSVGVVNEKMLAADVFFLHLHFRTACGIMCGRKGGEEMESIAKLWWLFAALGVMNLITFAVYAYDKHIAQSRKGKRRVPERTLLLLSFVGGCIGAALGMALCRHKTKHAKFLILVPLSVILWACALGALIAHLLGAF